MAGTKLTVVISQGQSKHPDHAAQEESIAAALLFEPGIEVSVVPHLYDLSEGHTGLMFLRSVAGDLVVLSRLFPRAAHWTLDRLGVQGKVGEVQLAKVGDDDEDEEDEGEDADGEGKGDDGKVRIGGTRVLPDRSVYCLDLRVHRTAEPYLAEVRRIAAAAKARHAPRMVVDLTSWLKVDKVAARPELAAARERAERDGAGAGLPVLTAEQLLTPPDRRWYPVIDYSRCTNCMECIDFCLFGVYGVDKADHIHVDQPDNCRKGCPACSRVCPEHAIIFPQHKTASIAGDEGAGPGGLKIDLTKLFGGGGADLGIGGAAGAIDVAAKERDEQLLAAGRAAVGLTVGIPKRRVGVAAGPKDDLDKLADALDEL